MFPFFELGEAAQDLRDGSEFDPCDARRRVAAQLETLRDRGIRHVVLGAFGCGAFRNPADRVAAIYRDEIAARATDFAVTAFAIFSAGYGPDNFTPFASTVWVSEKGVKRRQKRMALPAVPATCSVSRAKPKPEKGKSRIWTPPGRMTTWISKQGKRSALSECSWSAATSS